MRRGPRCGQEPRCSPAAVRRSRLEVADIFHRHGAAWRRANAGHVSLGQLKVMSAIEHCRSATLGGRRNKGRAGDNLYRRVGPRPGRRDNDPGAAIVHPTPTTPARASPTQATAPSNPHRRQPPTRPPAGSFLRGFRTPALSARGPFRALAGRRALRSRPTAGAGQRVASRSPREPPGMIARPFPRRTIR